MRTPEPVTAKAIETTEGELVLHLADRDVRIPWGECSPKLAAATPEQRLKTELSPGGYGIHWPLIDEDLSVNGLVRMAREA